MKNRAEVELMILQETHHQLVKKNLSGIYSDDIIRAKSDYQR